MSNLIYMKTYLFSVLLVLLAGLHQQTFAAQDSSFSIITAIYEQSAPTAEHFGKVTNPSIKYQLSWKEKNLSKMIHKKVVKARKNIQQGKKSKSLGGLLALVVIGLVLIPIGILILLPLFILGVILLVLGVAGAFVGTSVFHIF